MINCKAVKLKYFSKVNLYTGFAEEGSKFCEKLNWPSIEKDDVRYKALIIEGDEWKSKPFSEISRIETWEKVEQSQAKL